MYTIFIFHRDYRSFDNLGLNYAMKHFDHIIPIFIFTPEQIKKINIFPIIAYNFFVNHWKNFVTIYLYIFSMETI